MWYAQLTKFKTSKQGEYLNGGNLLAIKKHDKRDVHMLTTIKLMALTIVTFGTNEEERSSHECNLWETIGCYRL